MSSRIVVLALSASLVLGRSGRVLAADESADSSEHLVPLFNGKDLSGWRNVNGAPSTWGVRDGMIICSGKPICVLRTERQYENFVLELEWRHLHPKGNSGVFVWSDPVTARGQPFTRAIECQVLDGLETESYTSQGDVFAIHGAVMTPDRPHPGGWMRCLPSERRSRPSPEWNHYRITCKDGAVKLAVNGKEVSGGHDVSPRKGYICLESEGSETHFRNVRIQELPPSASPLPKEQVAALDEGFESLYTGIDLSGWRAAPEREAHWKTNDWRLEFDGKGETLWSERELGDFVLIADCRVAEVPKEGDRRPVGEFVVFLRGQEACPIQFSAPTSDDWRRATITVKGDRVKVELDGKVLTESAHCRAAQRGPIGLGAKGGAVQFANIYVKGL